MTSMKLEDVESYLVKQAGGRIIAHREQLLRNWLRDRFAELRAREASALKE